MSNGNGSSVLGILGQAASSLRKLARDVVVSSNYATTVVGWFSRRLDPVTMGNPRNGDGPIWNAAKQMWQTTPVTSGTVTTVSGTSPIFITGDPATNPDVNVSIATVADVGVVKPDGTTITEDPDGTLHAVGGTAIVVATTPFVSSPGAFTVAHGLGYSPSFAEISVASDGTSLLGIVGWQTALRWDATNFYLYGSDTGILGYVDSIQ